MTRNLSMLTDLYQLTMLNGYFEQNKQDEVVIFDLFFRENKQITFSVCAGLETAIEYLQNLKFTSEDIDYLYSLNIFSQGFLNYLKNFSFTGDVYAISEGTLVFPFEPILTIKANIMEAQLVETALLNIINHQTLIATKASKVCLQAGYDNVMEFGLRRAQGPDAGIYGARASIIGGCSSTSNVLAGKTFGIKVSGTHAHSWVMSFESEYKAFKAYAETYPNSVLLLVDTFDTLKSGIPNAIRVFNELAEKGIRPIGIRLDSGDLAYLTKKARVMLDEAGFSDAKICASGDLDENIIRSLKLQGARIDLWGVGTKLITSQDMPALGGVYKVSGVVKGDEIIPKMKLSDNTKKITNPGFKKVVRIYDNATNKAEADLICQMNEEFDNSQPLTIYHPIERWKSMTFNDYTIKTLTKQIMKNGELICKLPSLNEIANFAKDDLNTFWDEYKRLDNPHIYKVDLSCEIYDLKQKLLNDIKNGGVK